MAFCTIHQHAFIKVCSECVVEEQQAQRKRMYPVRGNWYTLHQIEKQLSLEDSASLSFEYKGREGCIQNSHLTAEQLLSVPGIADSKWRYRSTTNEWIPVFEYADERPITDFVDLERWFDSDYNGGGQYSDDVWWATPKGFPRKQFGLP